MATFAHTKAVFTDPAGRKRLKSKGDNTPPGSPAGGDAYLIGSSPTGAWASNADELTIYNEDASAWEFEGSPPDGFSVYVEDEDVEYTCISGSFSPRNAPTCTTAEATADTTTTSTTDTLTNSMTITPAAGTYAVWYTGSVDHGSNSESIWTAIYAAGSKVAASEREWTRGTSQGDVTNTFTSTAKVTVNGSQAIEGKWRTSAGTATMHERSLMIIKVN